MRLGKDGPRSHSPQADNWTSRLLSAKRFYVRHADRGLSRLFVGYCVQCARSFHECFTPLYAYRYANYVNGPVVPYCCASCEVFFLWGVSSPHLTTIAILPYFRALWLFMGHADNSRSSRCGQG